jgi:hypothetical protein
VSVFTRAGQPYGSGTFAGVGALEPAGLAAKLVAWRRTVAKRYRFVAPEDVRRVLTEPRYHVSTKIDGELWYLCKLGGEVALCSPTGRVLEGIPVVNEGARLLADCGDIIVAGELFALTPTGRPRVKDIGRALGDPALAPTLGFKAFDLVAEGADDVQQASYDERFARLNALFSGKGKRVDVVHTVVGGTAEIQARYDEWVPTGKFEGLVVRSETRAIYKIKPRFDVDAVILGYGEHREADARDVRELVVGLLRDDGTWQVLGSVGGGLTDADRVAWLARLEPTVVPSQFRMANSEGTLCHWVRPEIVIEISISDVLDTDSREQPIRRMTLAYDAAAGWRTQEIRPFVSPLHPVLVRERPDKPVDAAHVGVEQITRILPPVEEGPAAPIGPAAVSRVVERKVWVKAGKGGTAVRKCVLVETGESSASCPPWVAHFTDYSPGRKEPLQTALRVASSREKLDAAVAAWMAENVKKGWEAR